MNIQKISLQIFFPAMYLCAGFVLLAMWGEDFFDEGFFKLIPTFFVVGLAALITWVVSIVEDFLDIARNKK